MLKRDLRFFVENNLMWLVRSGFRGDAATDNFLRAPYHGSPCGHIDQNNAIRADMSLIPGIDFINYCQW